MTVENDQWKASLRSHINTKISDVVAKIDRLSPGRERNRLRKRVKTLQEGNWLATAKARKKVPGHNQN